MISARSPLPHGHIFATPTMSGSRQHSRSRLPPSAGSSGSESKHGSPRIRAGVPPAHVLPPLAYPQPHAPRALLSSSIDTISSEHGSYPSTSSPQTSSDYTAALVSSPATLDSLVARSNDPWTESSLLGSMGWEHPGAWPDYSDLAFPQESFAGWQPPPQDAGWHLERSATAPVPTKESSPSMSPGVRQSIVGYRRLQPPTHVPSAWKNLDANTEIPYPLVYSRPQIPSPKEGDTLSSSLAGPSEAFLSGPSKTPSGPSAEQQQHQQPQIVLPSSVEKAIAERSARRTDRTRNVRSRSAAPRGVSRTKIAKVSKGRSKPLSPGAKAKAEDMRYYGACWRCRKYKKPCTGPGVCDTCVTSGFRVWPSALGCRRGDLDNFAFSILPTHAEQVLSELSFDYPKPPTWRKAPQLYQSEKSIPASAADGDRWDQLLLKIHKTRMHGLGVLELLEIAAGFQRSREKENKVLGNAARSLSSMCDLYRLLVSTDDPLLLTSSTEIGNLLTQNRKLLITALSTFLNSCLTGRLKDWLPTFLASCIITLTYVVLSDAVIAVPPQFREKVWYNIQATVVDLRQHLYPTAQDLLSALAKGSKLLQMECWKVVEVPEEEASTSRQGKRKAVKEERNKEGMRMMDEDEATFDGLRALQLWFEKYSPLMRGDVWFGHAPYTVDVLPIAVLERMFDFSPRG